MSVVQHLDSFVHSFILDSLSTIDTFHQGVDRFWDAEWESSFLGLVFYTNLDGFSKHQAWQFASGYLPLSPQGMAMLDRHISEMAP